jgi:hypothetical protein
MSRSFRQILVESDIAAIAISILILWAVADEIRALGPVLTHVAYFTATAVAIRGIPSGPFFLGTWLWSIACGLEGIIYFGAAWVLSRWAYGVAPLRSLRECCSKLVRRNYA